MPIRIEKDPEKKSRRVTPSRGQANRSSGGLGGRSGGGGILTALLPFLIKRPKLLIIGGIIFAVWYFGFNNADDSSSSPNIINQLSNLGLGANFDSKIYDQAKVFEPLADNVKNPMPEKISLLKYAPKRLTQGRQGSCVAWASSYGARTILHSRATNANPNSSAFSPSFMYNQIALEGCQGSYIKRAMELMKNQGAVPFSKFGYNENDCTTKPNTSQFTSAKQYTINGYNRLTKDGDNHATDLLAIKQNLAQGAPVVIGMMVGGSFMNQMKGRAMWIPTKSDYKQRGFGGHAMCVIGYDDYYDGNTGAFQIMNSWGEQWGDKGVFWVSYGDFDHFTKEAYGLHPMGSADIPKTNHETIEIGLLKNDGAGYIPLQKSGEMTFRSQGKIAKQTRFKIEVGNTEEAYIYVFGQETDNSMYTLFPYTAKHSPYCGIVGTRLFPKDHSLYIDDLGGMDYFAILIANQPLDYNKVNSALSASSQSNLSMKLKDVFENELIQYNSNSIGNTFKLDFEFDKVVAAVVVVIEK